MRIPHGKTGRSPNGREAQRQAGKSKEETNRRPTLEWLLPATEAPATSFLADKSPSPNGEGLSGSLGGAEFINEA